MLKHPYNSFGNEDTICSYNIQTMNIQNKSLTDPPINTVNGPLSYYELDISFTDQILNDYPKRTNKDTLSRFSSLSSNWGTSTYVSNSTIVRFWNGSSGWSGSPNFCIF